MNDESKAKDEKTHCYEYISDQINREDGLINSRLTWVLTLNGLLFAALSLLGGKDCANPHIVSFLTFALPVTGIVISTAGLLGVVGAHIQMHHLTCEWKKLDESRWPRPFGDKKHSFFLGTIPTYAPPGILIFVWIGLLIHLTSTG